MSWNLWWRFGPWELRHRAIIETIRGVDPDVICLQEVWSNDSTDMAQIIGDELGYRSTCSSTIGRGDVRFANAVLSRWPAELICDVPLPRRDGTPGHRRIIAVGLDTPWGRWPVASTHLDHRFDDSATRQAQARRVLEHVASWRGDPTTDLPVILGGDLNAVPDSDEIQMLTGRRDGVEGIVMSDAWEQAGSGNGWTWTRDNPYSADSAWPNRRIDYVLISWPRPKPAGNPIAAQLVATEPIEVDGEPIWASDHAALVVDLVTPV